MFWQRDDLIKELNLSVDFDSVHRVRSDRRAILEKEAWRTKVAAIRDLPDLEQLDVDSDPLQVQLDSAEITIGESGNLSASQQSALLSVLRQLMPWRKGPFRLFGQLVDAEWRSNRKWDRIAEVVDDLAGRRILDLGCGNGYYMLRAAAHQPRFVLGFDPSPNFLLQFELVQKYLRRPELQLELLGLENLDLFRKTFDVTFCLGILYHHADPIGILRQLRHTLRDGGQAIIESQAIAGDQPIALFPRDRYAKARNVFFVPTASCLANWVSRAGFTDVQVVSCTKVTREEQRKTEWMVFESLGDFLNPANSEETIEGYPAPYRVIVTGRRGNA